MPDAPGAGRPSRSRGKRPAGFAADVVKLASGTAAAQVLTVGAAPILTRLFSPADFGTATVFGAVSGILVSIACLSYETAILLPKEDADATGLFGLSCLACVALSGVCAAVCVAFRRSIESALRWHGVPGWPWLMALTTLLGGFAAALGYWHSRKGRFGRISWARVAGSAAGTVVQLGEGALGAATPAGLVHGTVAASAATFVMQGVQLGRRDARQILDGQSVGRMWAMALRYRKFPLLTSWSTLLNSISWQLPALLLSYFFNSAIVGFYALGFRMLQLPMGLVGNSIAQVFFQRAARAKHEGTLAEVVRGVYDTLLDFGLLPMAVLGIAGPDIFTSILGPHWHEAGVYAQILAPWTLVWFISSPLHDLFSVLEMQGLGLWMDGNIFVSRLVSLMVGGWLGSPRTAVALFAGTGVLVYGYMVIVAMARAGVDRTAVLKWTARKALAVVPACAALLLLEYLGVDQWAIVGAAAALILARSAVLFSRYRGGKVQMPRPAGQ
jgi:lipopolysaccharide exporter